MVDPRKSYINVYYIHHHVLFLLELCLLAKKVSEAHVLDANRAMLSMFKWYTELVL